MSPLLRKLALLARAERPQLAFSIRITVGAVVAYAVASALHLMLPLWAVLTALIVTQMSVGRSLKTTRDYLLGTIGGAIYGGAIAVLIPHTSEAALLGLLVLAVAPLAVVAAVNPSLNTATVTAVIVLLVPMISHADLLASAIDRVIEVAVGAVVGLGVSFLVLPSRAHSHLRASAARLLELIGAALSEVMAGLTRGLDNDALHRIQDGIGSALGDLHATGGEAERERAAHLSSGPQSGPLLRTILRLRHDVVMIGRAGAVPLPPELQMRLARVLAAVRQAIAEYLNRAADALGHGTAPPPIAAVNSALDDYHDQIAEVRRDGLTRLLPADAAERFFALGFSLDQMRQNLLDLDRRLFEWCEASTGAD